jgi:hypothetical protein
LGWTVQLVQAANLASVLTGAGPFTVFAPSNAAFAQLPKALVNALLDPKNVGLLQSVLLYHVVGSRVVLPTILTKVNPTVGDRSILTTAQLSNVTIYLQEKDVYVNYAQVEFGAYGLPCVNGVIYVIDQVLVPPAAAAQFAALLEEESSAAAAAEASVSTQATMNLVQLAQSVPQLSTLGTSDVWAIRCASQYSGGLIEMYYDLGLMHGSVAGCEGRPGGHPVWPWSIHRHCSDQRRLWSSVT